MTAESLPSGWLSLQLADVVPRAVYGISTSLSGPPGIPILRMNNLRDGEVELSELKYSSSRSAANLLLRRDDVLFNRTNSIDHVGRTGVWRGQLPAASFASYLVRLEQNPDRLDGHFLNRWLNWDVIQQRIRQFATPGVHQVNINPTNLRKTAIALPESVTEQRKIVAILDTIDDAIRKNEQIVAKLKQVKQGLLHDLLSRGIDDNGELRDPERHPEQFKDSPLGRIPSSWEVVIIRQLATFLSYGFTNPMPTVDEGPWMVTAADIADGTVDWGTARRTSRGAFQTLLTAKSRPRPGDLLLTKDGTLGRMALLDRADVCINQSVALLRFPESWLRDLVFIYLRSPRGQERMIADAGGSTIKHIYISKLGNMAVPKPSKPEAEAIAAAVAGTEARLAADEAGLAKLLRLKAGLMDDLLTGRVRVTKLLESTAE